MTSKIKYRIAKRCCTFFGYYGGTSSPCWNFVTLKDPLELAGWTSWHYWLILMLMGLLDFDRTSWLCWNFLTLLGLLCNWCNTPKVVCFYTPIIFIFQITYFKFAFIEYQISKLSKIWNFKCQILYVKFHTSNFKREISIEAIHSCFSFSCATRHLIQDGVTFFFYFKCQIPNVKC